MDLLSNLALGFSAALSPTNLLYCLLGVTLGTFIGVLPGVGPLVTISVLLPLTFGLSPEAALIMLAGIYYGAAYGGSTTAILLNIPGESSSVMTCLDGHQLAKRGRAGPALAIAAGASFVAGCIGTVLIALFAPLLAQAALKFGSSEYFTLMLAALIMTAALVQGSVLSGIAMALVGVIFGLVGADISTGVRRFTFGIPELTDGIDFVVVAMGVFGIAEIVRTLQSPEGTGKTVARIGGLMPNRAELKAATGSSLRGTAVGAVFGILPGAGATISSFVAYLVEKKISRDPKRFGNGAVEGVAGPEAANNAAAQTAFIPTLTLGVPGSATMALMIGALMIQGIAPGPQIMTQQPVLFWGLIASMWIGNLLLVLMNLPLVGIWVSLLRVPYRWLFPGILVFSCIGVFSVGGSTFDVGLLAAFGVLGVLFYRLGCEPAPFIMGFILGPLLEENFRRTMLLTYGNPLEILSRPLSAAFLALAAVTLVASVVPLLWRTKEQTVSD